MDHLTALTTESSRIADVLADVDGTTPVPTCTDWTAADLAWHLTEVQTFWATMVEEQATEPVDHDPDDGRPETIGECLAALRDASARLRAALDATAPDAPVWSWSERGGTATWVRRRMAHEALIHRLDAEATVSARTGVDEELALDGIDELVGDFLTSVAAWGTFTPSAEHLVLAPSSSARTWSLELGRFTGASPDSGSSHDLPAAVPATGATPPDLVVRGTAATLDAWLWGRGDAAALQLEGEPALLERLRALAADATQ